jgi:hypothetical protein
MIRKERHLGLPTAFIVDEKEKNVPFFSTKDKKSTWWPLGSFLVDEEEKETPCGH